MLTLMTLTTLTPPAQFMGFIKSMMGQGEANKAGDRHII